MVDFYKKKLAECYELARAANELGDKYEHHLSDAKLYEDRIKQLEDE